MNPNRQKRQHTAYTLFVHEVYPTIRAQYQESDYQSKDIIGLVARQWANTPEAEKQIWKERALASHQDSLDVDDEDDDEEEDEEEDDDDDNGQPEEDMDDGEANDEGLPKKRTGRSKK